METMNEHKDQNFQDHHQDQDHKSWGFIASSDQESIEESSSVSSCSSFDTTDDASSSSSSFNSHGSNSLIDLSDLMIHLPIKKGLSKFYQGKSESFTSLARVMSIEDLPKKTKNPYNKMMKMKDNSKSYGGGLDNYKSHTLPKPMISKKPSSFLRHRSFARSTLVSGQHNN